MGEPESLVLVYLRRLDAKVDHLSLKIEELNERVGETSVAVQELRRDEAHHAETVAKVQVRMDRLTARLERVERRLDILPADDMRL